MKNRTIIVILPLLLVVAILLVGLLSAALRELTQCDEAACATFVEARVKALEAENAEFKKKLDKFKAVDVPSSASDSMPTRAYSRAHCRFGVCQ